MKTITLNLGSSFKRLCLGLLAVGLLGVAANASAQLNITVNFEGTLAFKGKMVNECPQLNRGDTAPVSITVSFGDAIPRGHSKSPIWSGEISMVTSSGVSVVALGTMVGDTRQGTLYISELIVGDDCLFVDQRISVKMQAN